MRHRFALLLSVALLVSTAGAHAEDWDDTVERRLTGVQKQVTVLHAKFKTIESEDGKIIVRLTEACDRAEAARVALEKRVKLLEMKTSAIIRTLKLYQENGK